MFVNGCWVGLHSDPDTLVQQMRDSRRAMELIASEVSVFRRIAEREIHVYADAGRICRPLLIVDQDTGGLRIKKKHVNYLRNRVGEGWGGGGGVHTNWDGLRPCHALFGPSTTILLVVC